MELDSVVSVLSYRRENPGFKPKAETCDSFCRQNIHTGS